MPESSKRPNKEPSKVLKVFRDAVCQSSFEICPDKFIWVKLRRVSRKVKGMDSRIFLKKSMDELCPVERTSIPEENDGAFEVSTKMPEELSDLSSPDVSVNIETRVESKPFSFWRDRDSRDSRYLCPASGNNEGRGFPFDRPGSLDIGNKRESTLIKEGQAGSKPDGLFLYGARRDVSSSGLPLPDVLWLSSEVSDSSSPDCSSDSRDSRYSSVLGNFSGLSGRYVSKSKVLLNNRLPWALSLRCAPEFSSACPTRAKDVLYWGLILAHCGPSTCSSGASALRSLKKRSVPGPPSDRYGPVSASERPVAAAFPKFGVCHEVS